MTPWHTINTAVYATFSNLSKSPIISDGISDEFFVFYCWEIFNHHFYTAKFVSMIPNQTGIN